MHVNTVLVLLKKKKHNNNRKTNTKKTPNFTLYCVNDSGIEYIYVLHCILKK